MGIIFCDKFHEGYVSEQGSMSIAIGYLQNHIFTLNNVLKQNFKDSDKEPGFS